MEAGCAHFDLPDLTVFGINACRRQRRQKRLGEAIFGHATFTIYRAFWMVIGGDKGALEDVFWEIC